LLLTNALLFVGEVDRVTRVCVLTVTAETFLTSLVHLLCLHYLNTYDVNTRYLETYLHGAESSLGSHSANQESPPFIELTGSLPFPQGLELTSILPSLFLTDDVLYTGEETDAGVGADFWIDMDFVSPQHFETCL
jgi:hypothetical protein